MIWLLPLHLQGCWTCDHRLHHVFEVGLEQGGKSHHSLPARNKYILT